MNFETRNLKPPPAKVTSDRSKFEVEINIAEYRPEVANSNILAFNWIKPFC